MKLTTAERPALSPSCPRDAVIPPLKSNLPEGAYHRTWPEPSTSNRWASRPPWSRITRRPGVALMELLISSLLISIRVRRLISMPSFPSHETASARPQNHHHLLSYLL